MGFFKRAAKAVAVTAGILVGGVFVIGSIFSETGRTDAATSVAAIDKSEAAQTRRIALIRRLTDEGIFQKVETPGNLPRVWVEPAFYALDFGDKQQFTEVVYAYFFDGSNSSDHVRLFDRFTGKEIGGYTAQSGLSLR